MAKGHQSILVENCPYPEVPGVNLGHREDEADTTGPPRYELLKEAILHHDRGTVMWLLKEGCPVNDDRISDTPLHAAVLINDADLARLLLSEGARIEAANAHRLTALHLAFETGNNDMVDLLLAGCNTKLNPFTVYGLSHFHIACVRNNWRVAHAFLEHGVNANALLEKCFYGRDYVYYRPLHLAVEYEHLELAELLLKYGANVDARDRYRRTPLHLACRFNREKARQRLTNGDTDLVETPVDVLRILREDGVEQVSMVELLLRFGADVEALDSVNAPPLLHVLAGCDCAHMQAVVGQHLRMERATSDACKAEDNENEDFLEDVAQLLMEIQRQKFYALLRFEANVRFCSESSKETLVHLVIDARRQFPVCSGSDRASRHQDQQLTRNDADQTSLASDEERADAVDLLLKYGADVDAKTTSGQTALHLAISLYQVKTVKALLNHYANVGGVCFFHYKIPRREPGYGFELADMDSFLEIVSLLLSRKFDLGLGRSNELLMLRFVSGPDKSSCAVRHLENCSRSELRRLLDFGEIDASSLAYYMSERSALPRDKISLILEHVVKLEVAGLPEYDEVKLEIVKRGSRITESVAGLHPERDSKALAAECKTEIELLKRTMIDRYASFYDLLFLNANEIAVRMKNPDFRRAVKNNCCASINLYSDMIARQFVKGFVRSILFDFAKQYLGFVIQIHLPDPCSEAVLGHLTNEDLCNLALAFDK
ncbi:hypothetical protein QAD02_014371 [Eretmocerus hayati]|uniref:Uncharacterized protein n=1 Tax=Eretmocerus hayati TaxID=131215 RepID=A0ACC2P5Q1_9HYME|nr:hypothetical protein QAD02_014371 [Eretmocerus hayati]